MDDSDRQIQVALRVIEKIGLDEVAISLTKHRDGLSFDAKKIITQAREHKILPEAFASTLQAINALFVEFPNRPNWDELLADISARIGVSNEDVSKLQLVYNKVLELNPEWPSVIQRSKHEHEAIGNLGQVIAQVEYRVFGITSRNKSGIETFPTAQLNLNIVDDRLGVSSSVTVFFSESSLQNLAYQVEEALGNLIRFKDGLLHESK